MDWIIIMLSVSLSLVSLVMSVDRRNVIIIGCCVVLLELRFDLTCELATCERKAMEIEAEGSSCWV